MPVDRGKPEVAGPPLERRERAATSRQQIAAERKLHSLQLQRSANIQMVKEKSDGCYT
jgi:hypothetical protein